MSNRGFTYEHHPTRLGVSAVFADGALVPGDAEIADGTLERIGLPPVGSDIAVPGLIDLQVNGYAGIDVSSASVDSLIAMGKALACAGVLAYQPTLISAEPRIMAAAVAQIGRLARGDAEVERGIDCAQILGVHVEGPFLSVQRAGAHPIERLRAPEMQLAQEIIAAGPVTMFTLAPELPGALEVISFLARQGIVVSLGHTAATAEEAARAVDAGASAVTHLFNGMPPITARGPGIVGFALTDSRIRVQLIADGNHVSDELLELAFTAASGRCSIVTDSTSLAAEKRLSMAIGGIPIVTKGGVARRHDGTIAGGVYDLLEGVRRLADTPIGLAAAIRAATQGPAEVLGRQDIGNIGIGLRADLVVLNDRLEVRRVIRQGFEIHRA